LLAITPQGDSGIAARDLETGWSLATGLERALIPFSVPARVTDAQVATEVFARFREIKGVFDRWKATADGKVSSLVNSRRLLRRFDLGEEVFLRKPPAAAPPKSRFQPRAEGPYIVLAQPSDFHVVLGDPTTREAIDGGAWVPVDQVVAFPRRRPLSFERGGLPGWGQSPVSAEQAESPHGLANSNRGWANIGPGGIVAYQVGDLSDRRVAVGKVFENLPIHKQVELHVYRALWAGVRAIWRPLYDAGNGELTLDASSAKEPVKEVVPYARLVLEVNLFVDGGMGHRPTRILSEAGWSLSFPRKRSSGISIR